MNGTDRIPSAPGAPLEPIQMLWVRGDLTRLELLSLRSFLAHGHPVHLYTYEPGANLPAGTTLMDANDIVPRALAPLKPAQPFAKGSMGSFSDYFRYHLLSARGGWWSDLDIVCTKPWRFAEPALTASTDEPGYGRIANNCAMRFPAEHPLMLACRSAVTQMEISQVDINQTGPLLLHEKMGELGLRHLTTAPSVFCPVPWNASWQLLRPVWMRFTLDEFKQRVRRPHLTCHFTASTVATHLWNETWCNAGRNKQALYPATCLYERYQRRWNPAPTL